MRMLRVCALNHWQILEEPLCEGDIDDVDRLFVSGLKGLTALSVDAFASAVQETFVGARSDGSLVELQPNGTAHRHDLPFCNGSQRIAHLLLPFALTRGTH